MSEDIPQPPTADRLTIAKNTMAELRTECVEFEQFVVTMLDQLEGMRFELADRETGLQAKRQRLEDQYAEFERRRDEFERSRGEQTEFSAELVQARDQLKDTQESMLRERNRADQNEQQNKAFCTRIGALEEERLELMGRLDTTVEELRKLESVAGQLEESQRQLNSAKEELTVLKTDLEKGHEGATPLDQQRLFELEQERDALEDELERARRRAAELSDTIAEQQRQLASERNGWSDELKQLRTLLETRSVPPSLAEGLVTPQMASARAVAGAADGQGANSDPVVGSVLAQFAQLKRDAAIRRTKK
jgi:chromosome segregation ATPase